MVNDIQDDPEVKRGVALVLAAVAPQFDEILAMLREMNQERHDVNAALAASHEERKGAESALAKLFASVREAVPENSSIKPPTRSIQ